MNTRTASLALIMLASSVCLSFASGAAAAPPPPYLVKNVNPGAAGSQISAGVDVNGTFYFSALREEFGKELWKSDGTAHGTVMVKDIAPGIYGVFDGIPSGIWSDPRGLGNVGGTLFFTADSPGGTQLWTSDGTEAGTVVASEPFPSGLVVGSRRFSISANQLYADDGSGPVQLTGLTPGSPPHDAYAPVAVGTTVYFLATDGITSRKRQLWKTDGTVAGTSLVTTVGAGREIESDYFSPTPFGGLLLFPVRETTCPSACYPLCNLWRTDGTEAGTFALTSLSGGGDLGPTSRLVDAGSLGFLTVRASGTGSELWKTDGTVSGTSIVIDLVPGYDDPSIGTMMLKDGNVYFLIDELYEPGLGGLWRSDGTSVGTTRIAAFGGGDDSSYFLNSTFVDVDGTFVFRVQEPDGRFYLWRSDGTPGGTTAVAETFGLTLTGYGFTPSAVRSSSSSTAIATAGSR